MLQLNKLCRVFIFFLWFCLPSTVSFGQSNSVYSDSVFNNSAQGEQSQRLLNWLGISENIEQLGYIIGRQVEQHSLNLTESQIQQLQQRLMDVSGPQVIGDKVLLQFSQNLPAASTEATEILSQALPSRVRNFDVVWSMSSVEQKWQAYKSAMTDNPSTQDRKALMKRLDDAMRTSTIAAMLQTELDTIAKIIAAQLASQPVPPLVGNLIAQQQVQRQVYLQNEIIDLHLFSYRYMKDAELVQYVELMESPSIKSLLDTAYEGLQQSLVSARSTAQSNP